MRAWQTWQGWRCLLAAGSIALMGAAGSTQPAGNPKDMAPTLRDVGATATACIAAKLHWNHTGIRLEKGQYLIRAQGTWWDAGYRHGPGGGESQSFFLGMMEHFRRVPDAPWFELICALDKGKPFRVGCSKEYDAEIGGELTCYANDVWGFYFNNTGTIEMTVTRTR